MNTILRALIAFAFLPALSAFAQPVMYGCQQAPQIMGQPPRCYDGRIIPPGTMITAAQPRVARQTHYAQPAVQPVRITDPGMYRVDNQVVRCSKTTQVVGNVLGAAAGYYLGRKIEVRNHRLGGLGAIAGAFVGDDIACEIVDWISSDDQQAVAQPAAVPQQAVLQMPATQAVSRSVSGVFCNIDGVVTKEADNAACEAKALQKAQGTVGARVDTKSQAEAPTCRTGTSWQKLNWPGHPQHDTYVCLPDGDLHRY